MTIHRVPHRDPDRTAASEPPEDDVVAALLRDAGPRPSVPADHAAQVEDATRAAWRRSVERERFRRRSRRVVYALAALLVLAVGLGLWRTMAPPPARVVVAVVESLAAPVDGAGLRVGETVHAGRVVEPDGVILLRLAGGAAVRADAASRVAVLADDTLRLERGAVYVESMGGAGAVVTTSWGEVRDIGTRVLS